MRLDKKILKYLYQNRNDGNFYILFERVNMNYEKIIGPVEDLVSKGLVARRFNQTLGMLEDPTPGFDSRKTNTECKITQAGILYYEKVKETKSNRTLSLIALIISIFTLLFTIADKLFFSTK